MKYIIKIPIQISIRTKCNKEYCNLIVLVGIWSVKIGSHGGIEIVRPASYRLVVATAAISVRTFGRWGPPRICCVPHMAVSNGGCRLGSALESPTSVVIAFIDVILCVISYSKVRTTRWCYYSIRIRHVFE